TPIPTSPGTSKDACTRRRSPSTRTGRTCIRTARSICRTATTWGSTGSKATGARISSRARTRRRSSSGTWRTSSGLRSTTFRSVDDGRTFSPFVAAVRGVGVLPTTDLPNTLFRDGILENFAASPTYPGHLYLAYEDWDGTQMDVKFTQSTDGGFTWSAPVVVNDAANSSTTDQFQPSVAAGPGGGVAAAFSDRRQSGR